ncbi:hypothetical protein HD554DRAFT_2186431 [Boletus coccyginus]|nr:hypothetical protein HD554DRAFT_2186431 [Boletus coccyginus]
MAPPRQESDEGLATERAWKVQYVGDAAAVLLNRIKNSLPDPKRDDSPSSTSGMAAIIQSSGVGKSRAVDEIAKGELVIPMVLRPQGSSGYPPADQGIRHYLTDTTPGVFQRVLAFLHALFVVVAEVAKSTEAPCKGLAPLNKSMPFAGQFRKYMNHNMTMTCHGEFRVQFYGRVVRMAYEILGTYKRENINGPSSLLNTTCETLMMALKAFQHPPSFVILSFDEVHVLENNYLEFSCALRALMGQPVFSLFLSTDGHVCKRGRVIPLFSELGFDHFAKDVVGGQDAMETDDMLTHVSSTAQLVKFGRPLWATRYDKGDPTVRALIVDFAALKLLGGIPWYGEKSLGLPQQLGCLAQRLPIEFLSSSYSSNPGNPQTVQVQFHMRMLFRVSDNLGTMITSTPSEPILSEAAYLVMSARRFKPASSLKDMLNGFLVDRGDRGELLVMLMLTIARDIAVGPPTGFGIPRSGFRWCSVKAFLSSLFVESAWTGAIGDRRSAMEEVLGDSKLYFSHFVKVHEPEMLNAKHITRLMSRGAAIFCANNEKGVDLVIPFTRGGLATKDLGVILVQMQNDKSYTANPKPNEFERMSVKGLSNMPTLRLFFALAAKRVRLVVDTPSSPPDTFNFWIAGLSSDILRPIRDEGDVVWKGLLDASYAWKEIYAEHHGGGARLKENHEQLANIRRSMYPGGATSDAHWSSWCNTEEDTQDEDDIEDVA